MFGQNNSYFAGPSPVAAGVGGLMSGLTGGFGTVAEAMQARENFKALQAQRQREQDYWNSVADLVSRNPMIPEPLKGIFAKMPPPVLAQAMQNIYQHLNPSAESLVSNANKFTPESWKQVAGKVPSVSGLEPQDEAEKPLRVFERIWYGDSKDRPKMGSEQYKKDYQTFLNMSDNAHPWVQLYGYYAQSLKKEKKPVLPFGEFMGMMLKDKPDTKDLILMQALGIDPSLLLGGAAATVPQGEAAGANANSNGGKAGIGAFDKSATPPKDPLKGQPPVSIVNSEGRRSNLFDYVTTPLQGEKPVDLFE